MNSISLKERIRSAKSAEEIKTLLEEGKTYEFSHPKTVRAWKKTSSQKLAALKGEVYKAPVQVEAPDEPEVEIPKKKRGNKKKIVD